MRRIAPLALHTCRAVIGLNSKETCLPILLEMPLLDFEQIHAFWTVSDGAPSAYNNSVSLACNRRIPRIRFFHQVNVARAFCAANEPRCGVFVVYSYSFDKLPCHLHASSRPHCARSSVPRMKPLLRFAPT